MGISKACQQNDWKYPELTFSCVSSVIKTIFRTFTKIVLPQTDLETK